MITTETPTNPETEAMDEEQALIAALRTEAEERFAREFHVVDDAAADWLVHQVTRREDELARVKAQFQKIIKGLEREIEFFSAYRRAELVAYAQQRLDGGKKKSLDLPHGRIGFRHSDWRIEVENMEEAVWAAEQLELSEAVKTKKTVSLTVLKQYMEETGEVLAGCKYVPAEDKFYVK